MSKGSKNMSLTHRVKNDSSVSEDVMNNPEFLARMQDEMDIRMNAIKSYDELPEHIKRRVHALKNFQLDVIKIEENFFRELSKLEERFAEQYQLVHEKRHEIVTGEREPTEIECEYDSETMEDLADDFSNKNTITSGDIEDQVAIPSNEKGIPDFWLKVLQHSDVIRVNIQEHDVNILKHLIDIRCVLRNGDDNGFMIEFYFSPNDYFSDEKLTKEYFVHLTVPASCPFSYEGPEIVRTRGCPIHWRPGKNVTVKMVKKVQKAKNRADKRTVTKVVKNDSFFNFFDPPTESLDSEDEIAEEIESILEADFEIGQYLRERIIPRAVLYYTGEVLDDDDEDEFDDDDEEDSEDGDSDECPRVGK